MGSSNEVSEWKHFQLIETTPYLYGFSRRPPPSSCHVCVGKLGRFTVVVNDSKFAIFRSAITTLTSADHLHTLAGWSNCSSRVMEWKITTPTLAIQTHESWPVWIYWRARAVSWGKLYGTVTRRQQGLGTSKRNVLSEKIFCEIWLNF